MRNTTDGITNRCGSFYMSLCASCFAAPLVAVRLNYKLLLNHVYLLITLIKVIFIFVTIQMVLFISDILLSCLTFPNII